MKKHIESSICKGLGIGESLHCFTPFRFIAIWGLGVGESLHCFTPFCFIAIWGLGRGIASLLHSVPLHRDLGVGEGNRFIASLRSASSRFGGGEGITLSHLQETKCNHAHMETINIAKRNFPSCSLRSQFTASQKLPLLFPNA